MVIERLEEILSREDKDSADYKAALWLKDHLSVISSQTLKTTAEQCGVSATMLSGLVHSLGFSDYREFREACRSYEPVASYRRILFSDEKSLADNIEIMSEKKIENIRYCTERLGQDRMRELVRAIMKAKRIFIFAQGYTRPLAHYLRTELMLYNKNVEITDRQLENDYRPAADDLFIFLSIIGQAFRVNPEVAVRMNSIRANKWLITCNEDLEFSGERWVVPTKDSDYSEFAIRHALDLLLALIQKLENE